MNKQTVLFGNGLNRLTIGNPSWDDLLEAIAKDKIAKDIPNTLRYEAIILKEPYKEDDARVYTADGKEVFTSDGLAVYAMGEIIEGKLKKDIAQRISVFKPNWAYDIIASLPVEHYITTNYDNTLLKAKGEKTLDNRYRVEKIYSIRRHYILDSAKGKQFYWPIHGNVDSPASIMLGFDHYCGSLSKIEGYIKGGYELPSGERLLPIVDRLKNRLNDVKSWIDLFFITDVHIIGLDLAYEEMDLWWILNKRSRIKQKEGNLINNRIVFYPVSKIKESKQKLLKGFGLEICELEDCKNRYPQRYRIQLERMKENMARD